MIKYVNWKGLPRGCNVFSHYCVLNCILISFLEIDNDYLLHNPSILCSEVIDWVQNFLWDADLQLLVHFHWHTICVYTGAHQWRRYKDLSVRIPSLPSSPSSLRWPMKNKQLRKSSGLLHLQVLWSAFHKIGASVFYCNTQLSVHTVNWLFCILALCHVASSHWLMQRIIPSDMVSL